MLEVLPTIVLLGIGLTGWGYMVIETARFIASRLARRTDIRPVVEVALAGAISTLLVALLFTIGIMKIGG